MKLSELLVWQMYGYADFHKDRRNLLAHIVLVPLFLAANAGLLLALAFASWWAAAGCMGCMVLAIAMQGRSHALETKASVAFTGPTNAIARLLLEQWITFPHFVIRGGWLSALRSSSQSIAKPRS